MTLNNTDNRQRSKPHRRVEVCLDELGINYQSEQYFSPYTVDIYLPEWHLVIEVDGPYHSKNKDSVRDSWLRERYGLLVLRLDVKRWRNKAYIKRSVVKFLEENAATFQERKFVWLTAH